RGGSRAEGRDDFGRRNPSEASGGTRILAPGKTGKKAGGEQIAGASNIRYLRDRFRWHCIHRLARNNDANFFAARQHRELGLAAQCRDGGVEVGRFIETVQLALVGEHYIDDTLADQVEKFRPIAVDAKSIRQRQRNAAACLVRNARSLHESLFGEWRIPKIAFEISDCGTRHLPFVYIGRPQILSSPE